MMAYRRTLGADSFQLSIDLGNWLNGHADWVDMSWGFDFRFLRAGAGASVWGAAMYNVSGLTFANAQWAAVNVRTLDDALGEHRICAAVRMTDAANDESCYLGEMRAAASGARWLIEERDSAFGLTTLASSGTPTTNFNNYDYARLEADGDNLKLFTCEFAILADTEVMRLEVTDTTITSGKPGLATYQTDATQCYLGSWAGGEIVGGLPNATMIDFGRGQGHSQYPEQWERAFPELQNGDWSVGFIAIPWHKGQIDPLVDYILWQGGTGEGKIFILHQYNGVNNIVKGSVYANGGTAATVVSTNLNSGSEAFLGRREPHFFVLQRRSGNIELFVVKKGASVSVAQATGTAESGTISAYATTTLYGGMWPVSDLWCFPTAALTPAEIQAWAVGVRIDTIKANPDVYLRWANGSNATEPNLGSAGGVATRSLGNPQNGISLAYTNGAFVMPPAAGYGPDWQRVNTGLRR